VSRTLAVGAGAFSIHLNATPSGRDVPLYKKRMVYAGRLRGQAVSPPRSIHHTTNSSMRRSTDDGLDTDGLLLQSFHKVGWKTNSFLTLIISLRRQQWTERLLLDAVWHASSDLVCWMEAPVHDPFVTDLPCAQHFDLDLYVSSAHRWFTVICFFQTQEIRKKKTYVER
jgi:hypothetical protein